MKTMSETTFQKYRGKRAGNYCTLPTIDVEILPDERQCEKCGVPVVRKESTDLIQRFRHADGSDADHYVSPATRCRYCHSHDAVYRQHAWHDAIECPRCGGVDGYAIGD
ncbi:hypothetical protein SEA_CEPENS_90 [Mycobacterium phage Cepens]|uniref:Uncharacterized protein n=1 Tax=Mycobacterium phage Taptic TaxID=1920305 RepID=A0A1J0MDY8_9CAUD|nr:hypothetical protein PQB71_gp74 [Mycobacterium phage Taptic]APD19316.1 hypothetical protein SEA_TAPTIC_91 [Mycobacterium phage Taptic]AVO21396.1 hypothetical protein PBI_MEGABEAR_88 [Mycobacterium phage Megabear]QBP31206.1 hypothetical protein SEA_ARGIE_91 [Mycobacterium phage Argie]QBP32749.1 hypothetical protein SEA_CEPENS_90 [Mycobacterium phage Cepens]